MLNLFRRGIGSWFTKGFMVILTGSFVIWGIADVFRNFGSNTVAQIGDTKISQEQFRQIYTDRLQQMSRQIGRSITPEQARALGFDRQILSEIFGEAALDQKVKNFGLDVGNDLLVQKIEKSPEFAGPGGFSHDYFLMVLRSNGMNEAQYINNEKRLMLRQQIGRALAGDVATPKVMGEALRRYQNELRAVDFVTLGKNDAGAISAPTPQQLQTYYDEHKALFRAPEYRKLAMIILTPETLAASIDVPEAELRKIYDSQHDRFATPEKREVEQIVFQNADDANAAAAKLASGTSFDALAQERKLSPKDLSLGTVRKRDILDPAVANAAFSLASGKTSAPISGRFGNVIVRVKKIEAGSEQPFPTVVNDIKKQYVAERARRDILDLHDKIEDERASGSTIPEIASKLKLKATTLDAVDRSGRALDGTKVDGFASDQEVLQAAFRAPIGTDNDTIDLRSQGGFIWYDVVAITPSRERSFDEAKSQVEARYRDQEIATRLTSRADEIRSKLDAGQTFAQAAPGISISRRDKLQRGRSAEGFDAAAINRIFDTPDGKSGILEVADGTSRIIYRVTSAQIPAAAQETAGSDAALARGLVDDILTQYIQRAETDLGISVNEAAIRSATGADRN